MFSAFSVLFLGVFLGVVGEVKDFTGEVSPTGNETVGCFVDILSGDAVAASRRDVLRGEAAATANLVDVFKGDAAATDLVMGFNGEAAASSRAEALVRLEHTSGTSWGSSEKRQYSANSSFY